ncbi:MAG: dimethylargininase [Myxococcota bacterium]|jgi:dimethylargininase
MSLSLPAHIVTRAVPAGFARALCHRPAVIDVARARAQHDAYVAALRATGAEVTVLPATDAHPDSCFVEDPVVVLGKRVLGCRSAAPSRQPEAAALHTVIATHRPFVRMAPPATLDGGDVLRIGSRLFVGRSERSNAAGIAALRTAAAAEGLEVTEVALREGLHLKSVATIATPELLVYWPGALDVAAFSGMELLATDEPAGGNVLAVGGVVLVSAAAPRTATALQRAGCEVVVVCVDEFHKADGALTCLSVRMPQTGAWVT